MSQGACLALLVVCALAPRSAVAACGDHVRTTGTSSWRTESLDDLLRGDLASHSAPNAPLPRRCHGPSCSNNVPAPIPSGAFTDSLRPRGDSLLVVVLTLPPSPSRFLATAEESLTPTRVISGVFHPPRLSV